MRLLDLYLIATRKDRYLLFGPTDIVEQCEIESGDRVRRFIDWLRNRPNRFIGWSGRALKTAHEYYVRLEDRIDPTERVLKAIACSQELILHYAPSVDEDQIRLRFSGLMRKQRRKHVFWLSTDSVITLIVILLTPILAPIPGPNVFFYYPALRLLSHYRALRGASQALGSMPIQLKTLPDLSGLEENLRTPRFDRATIRIFAERMQIRGLDRFLERMV